MNQGRPTQLTTSAGPQRASQPSQLVLQDVLPITAHGNKVSDMMPELQHCALWLGSFQYGNIFGEAVSSLLRFFCCVFTHVHLLLNQVVIWWRENTQSLGIFVRLGSLVGWFFCLFFFWFGFVVVVVFLFFVFCFSLPPFFFFFFFVCKNISRLSFRQRNKTQTWVCLVWFHRPLYECPLAPKSQAALPVSCLWCVALYDGLIHSLKAAQGMMVNHWLEGDAKE